MEKSIKPKDTFISGVIALMTSQITIRILGMIYSLYLTNKKGFGDTGNALYMSAYQVYAIFLTISSIGIPNAVSKIMAQNYFRGEYADCKKTLYVAIIVFSFIALVSSGILYFSAGFIARNILGLTGGVGGSILKILAPSIVFVSINSVLKGYYNGIEQIDISAKIQIIEQIVKTILTIIIVEIISRCTAFNTELMAEGAMISASFATILSLAYSINKYRKLRIFTNSSSKKGIIMILKEILSLSIPISIASFMMVLEGNIDSVTIIRILKEKLGENSAKEIYGIITSKVYLLVGLPGSLIGAIAMCLIPEISRLNAVYAKEKMKSKIDLAIQITLFISVPVALIMIIFSNEIMHLLYPNASKGAELLSLGATTVPLTSLTQIMSGILQGLGDSKYYLRIITIGILSKLIFNIILISKFLGKGAIISSLIVDMIIFVLIFINIKKKNCNKINIFSRLVTNIFITLVSIIPIQIFIRYINFNSNIEFIFEIICIIIIYFLLSIKLKIINIAKLPNTNYISKKRNF